MNAYKAISGVNNYYKVWGVNRTSPLTWWDDFVDPSLHVLASHQPPGWHVIDIADNDLEPQ